MLLPSHPLSKGKKRGYTYTLGSTRMFHLKGQESGRLGKTKILGKFLSFFFFLLFFFFFFSFFFSFFSDRAINLARALQTAKSLQGCSA
ncbi:hypothetical protein ACSS6W_010661 [Trichoderma asperelloides]